MPNIATLTYETLLAYVLPAAIPLFIWFYDCLRQNWKLEIAGYLVLGFLGLSVVVGLLFDMWGHIAVTRKWRIWPWRGWQKRNRRRIFFGTDEKPSLLSRHLQALYPDIKDTDDRVDLVYAIFNAHVDEHIYARRNWDWVFHEVSRNMLFTCPFSIAGLVWLAIQHTWSVPLIIAVSLATGAIVVLLHKYMEWSLETYYAFYANVVLGHLLEQSAQAIGSDRSVGGKREAGGN